MSKHIRFLFVLASMAFAAIASYAGQPEYYRKWLNVPSRQLINTGSKYAELRNMPDSALVCFTIVTSRDKRSMDKEERHLTTLAYMGRWYVYFFNYFDYSQAYENLSHAYEIAQETGKGIGRVLLNFGCMYQTISEQSGDLKPDSLALDYYKRSYWQARQDRDTASLTMAMSNMITVAHTLGHIESIDKEFNDYKSMPGKTGRSSYNLLLYEGLSALEKKQYKESLEAFAKQFHTIADGSSDMRYRCAIYTNSSRAYCAQTNYQKAIGMLMHSDSIAQALDMKDAKLEVYDLMADCYAKLGKAQQSEDYRNRYFRLKDTLLNYHQVASVGELRFLDEMKKVDKQIQMMEHQRRVQNTVIFTIVAIALLILLFMIIVWRKNKALKERNEALYLKNVEMLKKENEEKLRRHELEKQLELQSEAKPKYKTTSLDEDAKQRLLSAIMNVMENSDEIFSHDFTAQRLASLVGEKYNYVSAVINERFGSNFNTLVNEYRIREACKRMNDTDNYGNITIEGIANSVGFKSRTSFIQSFKKYTGLTPSEYQKLAKENNPL